MISDEKKRPMNEEINKKNVIHFHNLICHKHLTSANGRE